MLKAFANAFRTPDLRNKLLFVMFIVALFRLGSQIPAPGVHVANVQACFKATENSGIYGMINLFSGGALLQLTIFALGIMPYITASIILQLLVVVIPRLDALKKEGQAGNAKITQYTRYVTLALAILQATGIVALARTGNLLQGCNRPLLYHDDFRTAAIMVLTMTAGTAVIMWLGELVTERGIGNGMSILIFTQVIATFPVALWNVQKAKGPWVFSGVVLMGLAVMAAVIFIEQAQRRIPVQYARRMVGSQDVRRLLDVHPAEGEPGRASSRSSSPRACSTCPRWRCSSTRTPPTRCSPGSPPTSSGATTRSTWRRTSC